MQSVLLFLVLAPTVAAGERDNGPGTRELQRLKGTWSVEKQDWGKLNLVKDNLMHVLRLDINGTECALTYRDKVDSPEERITIKLLPDASHNPAQLDFASGGKLSSIKAIYKFIDDDNLVIAMGLEDEVRPTGFDANKESMLLLTLKRLQAPRPK
jgi:uncharacterized protein (TIGR03067 family)